MVLGELSLKKYGATNGFKSKYLTLLFFELNIEIQYTYSLIYKK